MKQFIKLIQSGEQNITMNLDKELNLAKIASKEAGNFLINENSKDWKKIISSAENKGVGRYFSTYGAVPNIKMKELYAINDFVLLPTLAEASTAVYPESFISQKVLLTSDIDFARELCGNAAVFFDPLSAHDIAEKIVATFKDQELQAQALLVFFW